MNRGLTGVIDAGQYTQALNIINNSTARVAALQSAPESCAAYLDFQCDANDNVATTVQRLDTYMKAAVYRLQTLMASSGGNRNGLSLIQTMIQIVRTTALTQTERNDFSELASNFTDAANATDLAQTTYGQDIAELLAALIDKNAEAAETASAPMSSNACAAVAKAFERAERLLHKAGTVLSVGGTARRIDTSMFESWSSRVDATGRAQLQPSGATLSLPQFAYQANSVATAGDVVVLVALRWKSRVDLCRQPSDLTFESDIHTVSALGDASRIADDVYFATDETMDMAFTSRSSSRTTGCSGPKECRWWNSATQAWDPSGCTYSDTTGSCSCTHLTDFVVVAPAITCPEAEGGGATSSGASSMIFVALGVAVVVIGVIVYFVLRKRKRKRYGKVTHVSTASVTPLSKSSSEDRVSRSTSEDRAHRSERGEFKVGWEATDKDLSVAQPDFQARGELLVFQAVESSSDSDGISQVESHVLPSLDAAAADLQNKSAQLTPRELGEEDAKVASPDEEDAEYMRRCKLKFVQLSKEYDMEVAMEKYDEFLSKTRDEVLAEPAAEYQGVVPGVTSLAAPKSDAAPAVPLPGTLARGDEAAAPVIVYDSSDSSTTAVSGVDNDAVVAMMEAVRDT